MNQDPKLLIVGHDLKFLKLVIDHLQSKKEFKIETFSYSGHTIPNKRKLLKILPEYKLIFCEWGLGNISFLSKDKRPGQKLIARIHSQEFRTSFLSETAWENVDKIVFVGPFMKEKFITLFPDCKNRCIVIPNLVDTDAFNLNKKEDAHFHLGLLGILPKLKAPHLALDLLTELLKTDKRYKLFIKSKRPEELNWIWRNMEERAYYANFFSNIDNLGLRDAVIFEPHDDEVNKWFRNIGFILSLSDNESFHLAVAEGMASGSIPIIRNWPGAKALFPNKLIFNDIQEAAALILKYSNPLTFIREGGKLKDFCAGHFSLNVLLPEYDKILTIQANEG